MSSRTFPLIAWGTADDVNSYTQIGTCAVSGGFTDPWGGGLGYQLNDTDGAVLSARFKTFVAGAGVTEAWDLVFIRQGTATINRIGIYDQTAAVDRHFVDVTWTAGVPALSTVSGAGTKLTPIQVSSVWWAIVISATGVVPGNTHRAYLYPASASAATTGTAFFCVKNAVLLDLLGSPKAFSRPAMGYERAVAPSGVRDAWKVKAPDEVLRGRVSWVPTTARNFPVTLSGFDGANESVGINCGVKAMLETGWDQTLLRFAPDRSACTTYNDAYLNEPAEDWEPDLEGNADRAFQMELVSATPFTGF